MLRQGSLRNTADATASGERPRDLIWPSGISQRERALDLAWLIFFLGAIGLDPRFPVAMEMLVWLPADLTVLVALWLLPGPFLALARRNLLLLIWPLLAITSTIWSLVPGISLYHGLQLLMTVLVGIMLCLHANLFRVIQLYFVALTLGAFLSLLYVFVSPGTAVWPTGEWQGLFRHKNMLGNAMALQVVTGVCLFLQGWRREFTGPATAFGAAMLAMSRSGAGIVAAVIVLTPLLPMFLYRRGHMVFVFSMGILLAALAATLLYIDAERIDVAQSVLDSLGKDATLTGRTVLWEFGRQALEERPWLGYGYHAWWQSAETPANMLRLVMKQDLSIFHNTYLETAVAFGVLGPIVLGAVMLFAFGTSVRAFMSDPQYIKAWPPLFVLLVLFQGTAEQTLFNNHGLVEVVLVAICSAGMRRTDRSGDEAAHPGRVGFRGMPAAQRGAAWQ
jgi:exopolysaccharide production protein ExoQ